jgi:hypothetical protein
MGTLGSFLAHLDIRSVVRHLEMLKEMTYVRNLDHGIMLLLHHQYDSITRSRLTTRFDHPPFPFFPLVVIPNNLL